MNPFGILTAFVPWWLRILGVVAIAATLFGAGWLRGAIHESAKFDAYRLSAAQQTIAIQAATIAKQTQMQQRKDEALNEAAKRNRIAQENLASSRLAADGLRDDLAAANRKLSSASVDALRKYAAAANAVLGDCASKYLGMAQAASGHASDALTLEQSWPK